MSARDYLTDRRIQLFIAFVLVIAMLDYAYGLNLGIEFAGGTQIPLTLEHSVTPNEMSALISVLQQRVSTFGLKQVDIEGIGNSQVYVTLPTSSGKDVNATINVIESQGVFQGMVNGREALNGSDIISGSIGTVPATEFNGNATWAVNFFISQKAAEKFASVVFGQGNQPIYMFLDRPTSAILLLNRSRINATAATVGGFGSTDQIKAIQGALSFGQQPIPVEFLNPKADNWQSIKPFFASHNGIYREVLLENDTPAYIKQQLIGMNYTIINETDASMSPQFIVSSTGTSSTSLFVESWPAVGLLSSPILSPSITNGSISLSYQISGAAPSTIPVYNRVNYSNQQSTKIASILSGGALPIPVIVDTPTTVQPTLGKSFMLVSGVIAILAVLAVAFVITLRYRKLFLIAPIMLTTAAEVFVVLSVIGLVGTIDTAAVAGMIAVVGTGVDTQIIMTDEIVASKHESSAKSRFESAFSIIWINTILLIVAMLPLLFSTSLVTIIGFSESTILGALLGVFVTRPAYGAMISKRYAS